MILQRITLKTPIGKKREDLIPVLSGEHNRAIDFVNALDSNITALESSKQDLLVSGTNIKTIGGVSILGAGNISVASDFTGLSDVPTSYTSQSLKGVRVNAGETALEFYTISSDTNLANTNLTLTANREHALGGYTLGFTGGNIGFGIASPTARMHVVGSDDLSGTYAAKIGGASTEYFTVRNDGQVKIIGTVSAGFIVDANGASNALTVIGGGSVGFGTASPTLDVHLKKSSTGTSVNLAAENTSATGWTNVAALTDGAKLYIGAVGSTGYPGGGAVWSTSANSYIYALGASNGLNIIQPESSFIGFLTGGTLAANERMRITSGGSIGIGTTSPTSTLHVVGSNDLSGTYAAKIGGATTTGLQVSNIGSVIIGSAAIATTATDGFLYVPTCAGTPTGTPTAFGSTAPIVIDSTNNKMYIYSGGAWVALN